MLEFTRTLGKQIGNLMSMIRRCVRLFLVLALPLTSLPARAAAGYQFVEGYNVLDTNNNPGFTGTAGGTNYAGTAAQERDIAVDSARGIIYIGHGTGGVPDGRGPTTHISAFVVTNGARAGSNFRDTGLIGPASGQPTLTFNQSLAYDVGSDKLWVLGSPLNATPVVRAGYRVGVPFAGRWREAINTDAAVYGGSGVGNAGVTAAVPVPSHGHPHSVTLHLPPLAVLVLMHGAPPAAQRSGR